jgi:hypothetical protein
MSIKMQCGLAFVEIPVEALDGMSRGDVDALVRNLIECGARLDAASHEIKID